MVIRLREQLSEESIAQLDPRTRLLVLNAEAEIDMNEPTGGAWSASFTWAINGNAAWRELERLYGEEGKPGA